MDEMGNNSRIYILPKRKASAVVVVEQLGIWGLDLVDIVQVCLVGPDLVGAISHDRYSGQHGTDLC